MSLAGENYPRVRLPAARKAQARRDRYKLEPRTIRLLMLVFGAAAALLLGLKGVAALLSSPVQPVKPAAATTGAAIEPAPLAPQDADIDWVRLEPAHRPFKVTVVEDSSLKLNGRPARLYGFEVLPRSKVCTYANGERWACGQRAYVAQINAMGAATVDCLEKNKDVPKNSETPRAYTCTLPGTDFAELMLKEGWGTLAAGVTDPRYVTAAATAKTLKNGMWRSSPPGP